MSAMSTMGSDFVREARKRAGLTQRELAAKAGTTQSAIARLESGRTQPSFDTVLRLVRLCGMDLDIMLSERDDSDWAQARRLLALTPVQRLRRGEAVARQMRKFREAGRAARAAGREGAA
jgi:transcriptional regulator with XRE-family HTH domain